MKISNIIKRIVTRAERIFGVGNHENDAITVGIYYAEDDTWQVWLSRPTQNQLDRGVFQPGTSKLYDEKTAFYVSDQPSLAKALNVLWWNLLDKSYTDRVDFKP